MALDFILHYILSVDGLRKGRKTFYTCRGTTWINKKICVVFIR